LDYLMTFQILAIFLEKVKGLELHRKSD
jgi:hypothetical protein